MKSPRKYETKRGTVVVAWPELEGGRVVRRRREYSDPDEAEKRYQELLKQYPIEGAGGLVMGSEARSEYHTAKRILPPNVSLDEAARYWVSQHPLEDSVGALEALEEYLPIASRTDKVPLTTERREALLRRFLADRGIVFANRITTEVIERFLFRGVGPVTIRKDASHIRGFCRWLVQRKRILPSNPLDLIELPSVDDPDPRTLDADQARALMDSAVACYNAELAPFFAVALFSGMRPAEIERLTKDAVKLDAKEPFIRVRKLKRGRGVRLTPISEPLQAWLAKYPLSYPPKYTRKKYRTVIAEAGLNGDWQPNIMRHTYISARMALGVDEVQVAKESGNTVDVLHRHYRDLLTEDEGRAVFAVRP